MYVIKSIMRPKLFAPARVFIIEKWVTLTFYDTEICPEQVLA